MTSLNEHGEKFAGRVFCPLQGIPLEGETRELSLYSHSKRHKRGDLSIHLCYKPCQVRANYVRANYVSAGMCQSLSERWEDGSSVCVCVCVCVCHK